MNDPEIQQNTSPAKVSSDDASSKVNAFDLKSYLKNYLWGYLTAHTFIGIGVLIMFFMAASDVSDAGKNISRISSVGGKTLEEAYYSELGDVYRGYALAIRAFGIFAFAIISKVGKTKSF